MRKALFKGTPLFAADAAQSSAYADIQDTINDYLTCPVCKQPVILRRGQVRRPHFAHRASDNKEVKACPYYSFYHVQSATYCNMIDDLFHIFMTFAAESNSKCNIDVPILPNHFTAFTLENAAHKYAFDIISWKGAALNSRISNYKNRGYSPIFIFEVDDSHLIPQIFEDVIISQKNTLVYNTSSSKWVLYSCPTPTSSIQYIEILHLTDLHWIDGFTLEPNAIKEYLTIESYLQMRYSRKSIEEQPAMQSPVVQGEKLRGMSHLAIKNKQNHDEEIKRMNEVYTAIKNHLPQIPFREAYNLRNRFIVENYRLFDVILAAIKLTDVNTDALHREMQKRNCDEQSMRQFIYAGAIQRKYPDTPEKKRDAAVLCLFLNNEMQLLRLLRPLIKP